MGKAGEVCVEGDDEGRAFVSGDLVVRRSQMNQALNPPVDKGSAASFWRPSLLPVGVVAQHPAAFRRSVSVVFVRWDYRENLSQEVAARLAHWNTRAKTPPHFLERPTA